MSTQTAQPRSLAVFRRGKMLTQRHEKTPQTLDFTGFAGLGATGLEPVNRLLKPLYSNAFSVRVHFSCTQSSS